VLARPSLTLLSLGSLFGAVGVVVCAGACSNSSSPPPTPPVSFGIGVFAVQVATGTANLSVLGPGGAPFCRASTPPPRWGHRSR